MKLFCKNLRFKGNFAEFVFNRQFFFLNLPLKETIAIYREFFDLLKILQNFRSIENFVKFAIYRTFCKICIL